MGTVDYQKAFQAFRERGLKPSIARFTYNGDMEESLKLVQEIGRQRNPRFVIDDDNRFAYENFIKWVHGDPTMKALHPETNKVIPADAYKGIYIAGNTGSGKSWAMEVMAVYASVMRFLIQYGEEKCCVGWRIARADEIVSRFVEETTIEGFIKCRMLCIQDLGSEPLEAVSMGNRMNVMRSLIESRGDRRDCLTLITSNYSLRNPALTEYYGERVSSRLVGMCNYLEIKGKDRRK
ncbi:MAG: hypothetical protein NC324_02660 [Bacteroides sp.]|nr:hypothetical protein [Bacteroides sp.]